MQINVSMHLVWTLPDEWLNTSHMYLVHHPLSVHSPSIKYTQCSFWAALAYKYFVGVVGRCSRDREYTDIHLYTVSAPTSLHKKWQCSSKQKIV